MLSEPCDVEDIPLAFSRLDLRPISTRGFLSHKISILFARLRLFLGHLLRFVVFVVIAIFLVLVLSAILGTVVTKVLSLFLLLFGDRLGLRTRRSKIGGRNGGTPFFGSRNWLGGLGFLF